MKPANLGCQKVFSKFKENTGFWKIKLESLQVWASSLTQDPVFTFLKYKKIRVQGESGIICPKSAQVRKWGGTKKIDRGTQTFHTKFQKAFIFFDWYMESTLRWPQTVLSITTLTTLKYLSQFYLQFHSCSLLHEQDFSGVIQTGIKCFAFHRINISSKTGQDHCYIHMCAQKSKSLFFHCLILLYRCGWAKQFNISKQISFVTCQMLIQKITMKKQ